MSRLILPLVLAGLLVGCAAAERSGETTASVDPAILTTAEPTWATIAPVLAARCASCHGAAQPAAGLDLTDWDRLFAGSDHGEAVIAYDANHSLLLALAEQLPEALPEEGYTWRHDTPYADFRAAHRLPDAERALIRRWIERGAPSADGRIPFADPDGRVLVAVQDAGMVSIIDPDRLVIARNLHFPEFGGITTNPHDTVPEPDGSAFYVTLIGAQRIAKVDAATLRVTASLDVAAINPTYKPGMLALDANSDRLFLSRSISDLSGGRSIIAIERSTMEGEELLVPFTRPHPIGLTRDGSHILSGSLSDNVIATIRADNFDIASLMRLGDTPTPLMHYDVSPDGTTAAITGQFSHRVYLLDITDPEAVAVRAEVAVGQEPWYPAFTPDGRYVVAPNHRSNSVSFVDVAGGREAFRVEDSRFAMPHGAAVTRDGRYAFITNGNLVHDTGHGAHGTGAAPATTHQGLPADTGASTFQPRYPLDRTGDGRADNLRTGHVAVVDIEAREVVKVLETREFASGLSIWQR